MAKESHIEPGYDDNGLPLCRDECCSFDGKRCRIMGFRPDRFCEPALIALRHQLAEAVKALEEINAGTLRPTRIAREALSRIAAIAEEK